MTRRFTPEELTFLRNRVPITHVIKTLPKVPTRSGHGKLSFACPVCDGFDTSINAVHNLARCFTCRENFNPIEFVMHQLQIDFVDSVKWLKKHMSTLQAQNEPRDANSKPAAIGQIIADIMPAMAHAKQIAPPLQTIRHQLSNLEQNVKHLYRLIDELRSSIDS